MHGPDECAFTDLIFSKVEQTLKLKPNTIKVGLMDEEEGLQQILKNVLEFFLNVLYFKTLGS